MNNISVTPKGGTIASNLSGNQINLTAPSVVKLNLNQSDIKSFTRNGNDLIVTTKSGETLVIHGFYGPNGESDLVLQDNHGALWWVEDPGSEGFHYVSIDSTEGIAAEGGSSNAVNTAVGIGVGGALLAGLAALAGGGGGGHSNSNGSGSDGSTGGNNGSGGNNGGSGSGDTTPPGAVTNLVITDNVGAIQGAITSGTTTDDNTPTLSGTAEAGSTVKIYDGSTLLGTTTAGSDGSWSFTTPALGDGQHSLTVTVTDAAGNTSSATDAVTFTVDTVAPEAASNITVTNNDGSTSVPVTQNGSTNDSTPVLSGTAEPGSTVTISDGGTVLGTTTAGSDGSWSYTTPPLSDGGHSITTTVTDPAGNTSPSSDPITFTVDTSAPTAATDLVVTDDVGAVQGPLTSGATTDDNTPTLSGQAEAGTTISVYDGTTLLGTTTVGSDGTWSYTTPELSNGSHSLTVTVTDAAGNVSPATSAFDLTVDAGLPPATSSIEVFDDTGATLVQLADGASTHDNTPTLTGLAGANDTITLYNGDVLLGTATADADGQWSFDTSTLADGTYSFHAVATDAAGNSADSGNITIIIDTVAPDAAGNLQLTNDNGDTPVVVAADGSTNDSTPVLSGTAEPGSTVTVSDGTTVLGTATVGSDGTWTFTSPTLTDGDHSLTTTVTDAAGNTSTASDPITFTVDTVAPDAVSGLTVTDDVGDSTGALTSGQITDDSTPTLSGQAEAGTTVSVYDGTTLLGTTTVGSDGNWSFTPPSLSNGDHSLTTTVTDAAGNVSPASPAFDITVEADLPPATSSLEVYDDTGATLVQLADGASTHDNTPTLTGLANANDTITIYNGDVVLGTVTADASGQWAFDTSDLADGTYAFHALATDAAGNSADSGTITIIIDTVAPDAAGNLQLTDDNGTTPVVVPADGSTNDPTPVLSGTAEPGSTVTVSDGDTVLGTATVGTDGTWTFTSPTLDDGDHSLTTTVTDAAGNTSAASDPITFTVDTVAPDAVSGLTVTDDVGDSTGPLASGDTTDDSTPTLSGQAEAGSTVSVYDGTTLLGTTTVGSDGNWSFTPSALSNGDHSLTTTVTDAAGNVSAASPAFDITVDADLPPATSALEVFDDTGATLVQLVDGASTHDNTPTLTGLANANDTITLYNGDVIIGTTTADASGQWTFDTSALADGTYAFHALATDAAGNSADSGTITIIIDTVAPDAAGGLQLTNDEGTTPVVIPDDGSTNDTTPVLSGTAEPGSTVTVSDGDTVLGTATVGTDGTWSFTSPTLTDGDHSLTTTVSDAAGNTSPASDPITFTVDTQAPDAATGLQISNDTSGTPLPVNDNTTNDTTPVLSGSAEAGTTVTVYDGTTVLGTTTVGTDGTWSFTPTDPLTEGSHSITTTVTDAAGNVSDATAPIDLIIDTTAPAAADDVVLNNDNGSTPVVIADGGTTNDATPVLSGTAEAGSTVTVLDGTTVLGTVIADDSGNWSFTPTTLADGDHSLTTTVTDVAGNVSDASAPITFTLDTLAPAAANQLVLSNDTSGTAVPITNDTTNDTTPVLSGVAEPGTTVTVSDNSVVLGTAAVDADGNWSFTPTTPLDEGSHSLTTTVTDAAGNTGPASPEIDFTVDTTAPATATDVALNNDQGSTLIAITDGDSTNDATPVLSGGAGSAEAGSTVTVYDGTTVLGTVAANDDGSWSFTTPVLASGDHSLSVTVTDSAGNSSAATAPIAFTVDTTAPDAATDLQLNNDSTGTAVPIADGGSTNDTTPLLTGTAEANSIITVYDGDTLLGTTTADATGAWSYTPTLTDGDHSLTVTVTDEAGNISPASDAVTVTVDTVAPSVADLALSNDSGTTPVAIPAGGLTNDSTPVISGTAEAGSTVTLSDGANVLTTLTVDSTGTWSYALTTALTDGTHTLSVTATDAAGNVSSPATISLDVDTTAPDAATGLILSTDNGTAPVTTTEGTFTSDSTPIISGAATAGDVINVYNGDTLLGTTTVGSDGQWTITLPQLADGAYTLSVAVGDAAGNLSTPTDISFTVDTAAPAQATIEAFNNNGADNVAIADNGITNDNTPLLSGTAEAGSLVTIYDADQQVIGTAIATDAGTWSFQAPQISDGTYTITATVTDEIGNVSAATSFTITVDATAPEPVSNLLLQNDNGTTPVDIPNGGTTNDGTPVLSGTAEAGSLVTIINADNGETIGTVTADATTGAWSFAATTDLPDGTYNIGITVTDAAGNVSATTNYTFTVDLTAPDGVLTFDIYNNEGSTPVLVADNGSTNDDTPVLRGTAAPDTTVNIYQDNVLIGTAEVSDAGVWRFETSALADGTYTYTASVVDSAGNESALSTPYTITVDTVVPEPVGSLVVTDDVGTYQGPLASGDTTDDNTPTFSGTAETGATVSIYEGTTLIGTATITAGNDWTITPSALGNGIHDFSIVVTDAAGNESSATTYSLNIEAGVPPATSTLEITDDAGTTLVQLTDGDSTDDNTPVLSGLSTAGDTITIYDGVGNALGTTVVGTDGQWSFTPTALADGSHAFFVTTTDASGNITTSDTINITIDTVAPDAATNLAASNDNGTTPVAIPDGGETNDNTPLLTGTAEANGVITVYDGDTVIGTTTADASGNWSLDTPILTNGSHTFSVTVTDAAGNVSDRSDAITLTVDTHAPAAATLVVTDDITDTVVPDQGTTNDATPTLSGTAEAGSTVTISDGSTVLGTVVATDGTWTFTTGDLTDGSHTFSVTATDAAGNTSVASATTTVIIDTVAPDPVTVTASNNDGTTTIPIANDGTTNDNTPALSGTAEAGSLVTISDGTNVLGTVTADGSGNWSFTSSTLTDGSHTISVTATDAAGNVSTPSTITFTVSTTTPDPVTDLTVTDNVGTITGELVSGATTDDTTPTLAGNAGIEGNIITIYDGTTVLGTVTAGTDGAWTFTTSTLTNGLHPLSVTVTDAAGNTSAATDFPITVDTVAPTASTLIVTNDVTDTVIPNGSTTNDTTPTLSGVAEAGSTISIYDNGVLLGTTTADTNGAWNYTTDTLDTGSHPLTVTATDAAGNTGVATAATVIIDTTAPDAVTVTASNNNSSTPVAIADNTTTNDSTPVLSGTAEAGSLVTISEGTAVLGTVTAGTDGSWSFTTATLSNGEHTFSITATDAAGNVSTATDFTLTVDTVAPAVITDLTLTDNVGTITGTLANNARTDDSTPTLSGTAEAGAIVSIYDGSNLLGTTTADDSGAWSYTTSTLSDGLHTFTVTATDAAGNASAASTATAVTVDTVAPTAATDLSVNTAGTTLSGEGEANATVTVKDANGNIIGTGTVATDGSFSVTLTTTQTTGATLSVTQTDVAGNVSPTATVTGAITVVAANDTNTVDYTTVEGTINNGTSSVTNSALLSVTLGGILTANILSSNNSYLFSVGTDDTRSISVNASISGISLLTNYGLYLYEQQSDGTWHVVESYTNYISVGLISLGTETGATVSFSNLGTGNYALVLGSTSIGVGVLPVTTINTVSDITSLAVTVAATVTGNLLENDTSSESGTIPAGTAVTEVGTTAVADTGNTVITSSYGTLTINAHGDYTYTLKAGLDVDTLPTTDTFTYSVTDANGVVTTATLTLELHDGVSTTLTTNSLLVESTTTTESDASGSIYGDSTTTHTGTLSITNEHGDTTTVSSTGTTSVTGDYGVLSIAANGSYTYSLSADVNAQNITHKEVFTYSLAATDGTITTNSFTIDLHPTITGTSADDTLTSSVYNDTITAGEGADTLVYHLLTSADATGGNGQDTWTDFSVSQGDKIDVSNLLIGWNDSTSNVNDFVKVDHTTDGNTVLSIDRDGTGTAYSSTQLITLEGVNASLEELLQQPHQNTTA